MRHFNTSGPVFPEEHYLVPPLERVDLDDLLRLVRLKKYFVLHAPRQTGKTTTLLALCDRLNEGAAGPLRCVYANLEEAEAMREDLEGAIRAVLVAVARGERPGGGGEFHRIWPEVLAEVGPGSAFAEALTRWSLASPKPLVLLLDEVDTLVGDSLISLLRQLRSGYSIRSGYPHRRGAFPQSVVLCGVRDVRDYRMQFDPDKKKTGGGSAFNIKAKSLRLGDFRDAEIRALYAQHTEETGQEFEPGALDTVREQTQGQPWLVNALANEACFENEAGRDRSRPITAESILAAREALILRRDTHIDQLAAKLQEDRVRRVIEPLLIGASVDDATAEDTDYVRDLGLIARDDPVRMANPIYREVVPRELTRKVQSKLTQETHWFVTEDGALDVEELLSRFRDYFRQNSEHWAGRFDYAEAGPHLLLQAFCQRIVNGGGRVEREYGLGRHRADLLLEWPRGEGRRDRFVVECKVLRRGRETTEREGLEQTAADMDRSGAKAGHLVIFDRSEERSWAEKIYRREAERDGFPITIWGM